MKKYLIIAFLVFGLLLFGCPGGEQTPDDGTTTDGGDTPLLGGDKDEHGCIPSAGYSWCEPLQECIRPWETNCTEPVIVGNDSDEHGCKGSAGYSWCESLGECIRSWETECPEEAPECVTVADCGMGAASCVNGKCSQYDEHGCVPDGGYSWCESLQECIQPWETECPESPMVGNDSDEHGCIGSAGYSWCEELQECVRPWETNCTGLIDQMAEGFCGQENVDKVYVCGDHFRTVSTLAGGGSTIYDATGHEITTCPVVGPDSMSDLCKQYLLGDNCVEKEIC